MVECRTQASRLLEVGLRSLSLHHYGSTAPSSAGVAGLPLQVQQSHWQRFACQVLCRGARRAACRDLACSLPEAPCSHSSNPLSLRLYCRSINEPRMCLAFSLPAQAPDAPATFAGYANRGFWTCSLGHFILGLCGPGLLDQLPKGRQAGLSGLALSGLRLRLDPWEMPRAPGSYRDDRQQARMDILLQTL